MTRLKYDPPEYVSPPRKSFAEFCYSHGLVVEYGGIVYKVPQLKLDPRVVLPCWCGDELCEGWAFVRPAAYEIIEHWRKDGPP